MTNVIRQALNAAGYVHDEPNRYTLVSFSSPNQRFINRYLDKKGIVREKEFTNIKKRIEKLKIEEFEVWKEFAITVADDELRILVRDLPIKIRNKYLRVVKFDMGAKY